MKKEDFARVLKAHAQKTSELKNRILMYGMLLLGWLLVVGLVGPIGSPFLSDLFFRVIPVLACFFFAVRAAYKNDRVAKEGGLKCPGCKRFLWGVNGVYVLQHSKCKRCGYKLIDPEQAWPEQALETASG